MTVTAPSRPVDATGDDPAPSPGVRSLSPLRLARKVAVTVAGIALIIAGIVMMVLPGPGVVAILAGLGLLGTEYPAARRASDKLTGYLRAAWRKVKRSKNDA
ncbi:hypothetical protein GCM10009678_71640 [Actinomadura kijaniata]|uniref:Transmembrane protein (PGPGW) n=1 Tax=Actinomadura namibiensis TaxID=182080 RepID=A0A7W3LS03_ACTNM|nr:PGPGW domain-containing protein [Actinomadura namibiensis]MBA8953239.1 hypothetical protein [Actinomadura namibiensis]